MLTMSGRLEGRGARVRWVLPGSPEGVGQTLAAELGLHPIAGRVLAARGFATASAVQSFLADRLVDLPEPLLLKGMPEAVSRLTRAVLRRERVVLYGDYDVDGVCSTTLLALFLRQLGVVPQTYIPHRLSEGYGLNAAAIARLADEGDGLLVTLDCGITAHAEIALAKDRGLDVIVVDHHAVPPSLPPADAVLNPMQPGCQYPTHHLCAAGVTFNLCMAMRRALREVGFFERRPEPDLRSSLDLVALATIADVVPLTGVNRILVKHGLKSLAEARRVGIQALKEVADVAPLAAVSAGQVGYRLAPRLNAAGRLDDASVGLQLLMATTQEEARRLAGRLEEANAERQRIEQTMVLEAAKLAAARPHAHGLVLAGEGWHPGVVGIVASRMVERFHRPTVVVALKDGLGRGSARSIEGFHLYDALKRCEAHLSRFGGHKHAAGLSLALAALPAFTAAFEEVAAASLTPEDLVPRVRVDAVVSPEDLTEQTVEAVSVLAPFGHGNPEPVFVTPDQRVKPTVLKSRRDGEPGHLKLRLEEAPEIDAIGFGMAERVVSLSGALDLAYQLSVDEWRGSRRVCLRLKDVRAALNSARA